MTRVAKLRVALVLLATSALAAPPLAAAAIYRCQDGNRVTYTDRRCEGGAIGGGAPSVALAMSTDARETANGISLATVRADPLSPPERGILGMTVQHVFVTLGRPQRMSMKLDRGLVIERWTYRGTQGRTDVLFRLGRVAEVTTE